MARGRILDKDISESDSFARLKDSNSQLLCALLTSWWDDHGKMIGDEAWIKGNIVRKLPQYTLKEVARCLQNINNNLNVQWWTDPNTKNKWLYWEKFDKFQTISDEKKTKDKLPSPKIPKNPQENSGGHPQQDKISKDKISIRGIGGQAPQAPQDIYEHYSKNIKAGGKEDAVKSITKLLKTVSKEDLMGRIDAYKAQLVRNPTEPRYYIQANNFFGLKARYKDFEPIKVTQYKKVDSNCKMCKGTGVVFIVNTSETKICDCRIIK